MNSRTRLRQHYIQAVKDTLKTLTKTRLWFHCSPSLQAGTTIQNNFFGINIAPSSDPQIDDYIVDRLKELHLQHVRMDFTYDSINGDAERLLKRILSEGFQVMLDLLPPFEDASKLTTDVDAQQRWTDFVGTVAEHYGEQISCFEIGATPNRGRWSGFEPLSYLIAWKVANEQLANNNILLAGPNVSDFEPISNVILLAEMQRQGNSPDIHTDNLFVERVVEPEAYDHRVLGQWATKLFKFNLVKKTRVFQDISHRFGAKQTVCSYKCWTTKRLNRWSNDPQSKKADYLIRYLVIAAASGALDKVYWGPLICSRDGLIDDGAAGYPRIDNVSFYKEVRGHYDQLKPGKAFYALANLVKLLNGAECVQAISADNGINHFIFNTEDNSQLHINWTRDRQTIPVQLLYTEQQIAQASFLNRTGDSLMQAASSFSERPLFMIFKQAQKTKINTAQMAQLDLNNDIVFADIDGVEFAPWSEGDWTGAIAIKPGENLADKAMSMLPENLLSLPKLNVHRDQRNIVWSIQNPANANSILVVKENHAKGLKKLSYRFKDSKAKRHWNNASEMIRRGVNSPTPIAFFERTENAGTTTNYYVCDYVADSFSARDAFSAFARGEQQYDGVSKEVIFQAVSRYACHMHGRKIIHHDLSGGNLLMTKNDQGGIDVTAIDIGRATILKMKPTEHKRLLDLMRLCYKLDWPNRELFMQYYFDALGKTFSSDWKKPLKYYDWKHKTKRKIKRFLKGKK
ncbi:MAG: lipopolysaccharide kinase InaA family protein [Methylophagaceae bacterium]